MNPNEKLNALSRRRKMIGRLRAAVWGDIVANDGFGDISIPLFVAEVEKDAGDIDADTDHDADIERIQLFHESLSGRSL